MAIDRIGKGGPPTEVPKADGARPATGPERAFEARAERAEPARAASDALDQLRSGKIDIEGYLQMKLDEATAHLHGLLPADLATIRQALRERLASDPTLVDLAKQATGQAPPVPDDE